jgi:hypothetical protein
MSTTTTATIPFTCDNRTGTSAFKIRYRLSGTTIWTQQSIAPTGSTVSIPGLAINKLYDFQVVNINGGDNPASAVTQNINITDPNPEFYPTNTQMGVEFDNLSEDIDSYTLTIAVSSTPGTIIETEELTPEEINSYTFTDLVPGTRYVITITPAANQFTNTFIYTVTTSDVSVCPQPNTVTATII